MIAASDLKRELESLQYREHKTVALQGQIAAVRHLETTCRAPPVPDFSPTACFISTDQRRHESFWFVQVPDDDPPASTDRRRADPKKRRIQFSLVFIPV